MNAVLEHQGLPVLEKRRHAARADHQIAGDVEKGVFATTYELVKTVSDRLHAAKLDGIDRFRGIVAIDDPEAPSFAVDLAKAILVASLGHLAGWVLSGVAASGLSRVAKAGVKELEGAALKSAAAAAAVTGSKFADVTTDTMQTMLGNAVQGGATAAAGKDNALKRAAVYFVEGRKSEVSDFTKNYKSRLALEHKANTLTVAGLDRELAALATLEPQTVADEYFRESAKAWALYLAQSQLGTDQSRKLDGKKRGVSDMAGYFGPTPETNKTKGSGILHATFTIRDNSRATDQPVIDLDDVGIYDLNNELRHEIINDAEGILDRIYLPKEIKIRFVDSAKESESTSRDDAVAGPAGAALMAVDERGEVRDHASWGLLRPPRGFSKVYRDPKDLWARIRQTVLTKHWQLEHIKAARR